MIDDEKYQRFYGWEDCSEEKAKKLVIMFSAQSLEECRNKYHFPKAILKRTVFTFKIQVH